MHYEMRQEWKTIKLFVDCHQKNYHKFIVKQTSVDSKYLNRC